MDFKKIGLGLLGLWFLYAIIASPAQAADLIQIVFEWISEAAKGIGHFMSDLLDQATSDKN